MRLNLKQQKTVSTGSVTSYAGNYIYENNTLKFFSHAEGYTEPNTEGGFEYVYQYKDHLGNIRLSYSDMNKDGVVAPPQGSVVFSDGFESGNGWDGSGASWGHSVTEFDQDRVHEGSYSARIYAPQGQSRVAHSNEWVSISNSEPTEYRYSGWAYSESPVIRLGLAMKEDGETGYLTLFDDIRLYNPLNEWVYVEKHVTVPAHITSVNLRLECAAWGSKVGNVWWDDVKIEVVSGGSEIVEENNYYPFGLEHKGYNNVVNGREHKYGFGGKEENDELGLEWLDFGARNYDPALGRWMNLDPLAEKMRRHSPYNYAFNNPVYFIDPDGMQPMESMQSIDEFWDIESSIAEKKNKRGEDYIDSENNTSGPDDWVEDADGNIKWDENATSQATTQEGEKYLGKAVVVFEGSPNEKLGSDGTLTGDGANSAKTTVYGPKGPDDIKTYDGLTVSSDPSKYSMIEAGDYKGSYQPMATSPYGKGSLTYRISNLDGSTKISPVGGLNKNGKSYMEGIFLHRTDWSGKATRSSQGCLCIDGRQWKGFESQLGKMKSFRIRVTR